jgi:hypothetical protein
LWNFDGEEKRLMYHRAVFLKQQGILSHIDNQHTAVDLKSAWRVSKSYPYPSLLSSARNSLTLIFTLGILQSVLKSTHIYHHTHIYNLPLMP